MNFILRRLLLTIPMLLGITFLTYLTIFLAPGGPGAGIIQDFNPKVSPQAKEKMIKHFHFDEPVYVQYGMWLKRLVTLDWGESYKDNQPVAHKILTRLPRTLLLSGLSIVLTFLIAIPIGLISAMRHNTWVDKTFTVIVFIGFSVPAYWIALLLMIYFGIYLGWLPITGFRSIFTDDMSRWEQTIDIARHLVLPLIVSSFAGLALLSRNMRNSVLEIIRQDYIRTARAKGLPEKRIVLIHVLRNTLLPIVTLIGLSLPELISASVIFESIFSFPGLGRLAYEAAMSRDTFLIMPTVTITAFLTLIGNLVADILYSIVDPRVRNQ